MYFVVVLDVDIIVKATLKVAVLDVVVVVVVVDVVFVVVVDLNVDVVVLATSKVDLRLLVMELEFGWDGLVGWKGVGVETPFLCQNQHS